MKCLWLIFLLVITSNLFGQAPCNADPVYRQFDFWIGEWEVFGKNGKKAGDSKIELILDSCIILENWKSANPVKSLYYSGKSFNSYNTKNKQWQQTWVDNIGGKTEYSEGRFENNSMVFQTAPFLFNKDTMAIQRLTFYNLGRDRVRQLGEISKDNGLSWVTQYDLEYRRKKSLVDSH
jgi:hypothetical protein